MTTTPLEPVHPGIVSVEELRQYMSTTFNTQQQLNAARVLAGVQQELENYLNRPLELIQMRELLHSDAAGHVNVTVAPVHKVILAQSISSLDSAFDINVTSTYTPPVMVRDPLIGEDGRMIDRLYPAVGDPLIVPGGIYVGVPDTDYAVEYIGGYNGYVDEGLKLDIKRVAAREVSKNSSMTLNLREGNADTANEPDSRPRGWTEEELKGWDRLRRRVII